MVFLVLEIIISFALASFVKKLQPEFSVFTILFFRYLFCLPLLISFGFFYLGRSFLNIQNIRILILRIIFGFLGLLFWFLAVSIIDISLATVLAQTMPIFIIVFSVLIAREKVGVESFGAVLLGFIGVLVLSFPLTPESNLLGIFFALSGALFAALMFVFLRILGRSDSAVSSAIWYNVAGLICSGFIIFLSDEISVIYTAMDINDFMLFAGFGFLASFQQFFLAQSHSYAKASTLAPFHYLSIPIGITTGILFFNEIITLKFVIGTLIIAYSSYSILVKEQSRH